MQIVSAAPGAACRTPTIRVRSTARRKSQKGAARWAAPPLPASADRDFFGSVLRSQIAHQNDGDLGAGRAVARTEFGGYTLAVPGHTWGKKRFGYKPLRDEAALADAFRRLYEQQIIPAKEKGLAASVYTQLSDVEDECNGFVTYDRKVVKLPKQLVREISLSLRD